MSAMLDAALSYAERGWRVFPLHWPREDGSCSCGNAECGGSTGKHPLYLSYQDRATTGDDQIRRWWRQSPEANIGILCGVGSRLAVVDLDGRDSEEAFRGLCARFDWHPRTPEVHTGREDGGKHLYFSFHRRGLRGGKLRHPETGEVLPVELKASRLHVVAPPSTHRTGSQYTWDPERHLSSVGLERLPDSIADLVDQGRPHRQATSALSATEDYLKTIPPREYVEDLTGARVPGDGKIRCPAPGHNDRTPSFHVYDEPERGWYCFGACQRGGSIYDFAALLAGLPVPCPRGTAFLRIEDWLLNFYTRKLRVE